jgi:hypothetical protein
LYHGRFPKGIVVAISPIAMKGEEDLYWIQNGGWPGNAREIPANRIREYLRKAYTITMRAGRLAWRVTYFPQENIPAINFFEYRSDCVRYIYPCGAKGIHWSPIAILDDLQEFDMGLTYAEKPDFRKYLFFNDNTA